MRTATLFALCGAAMLALVGVSHASPLSASGTLTGGATNAAINQTFAEDGVTQVRYRKYRRHYGWYRGHHHGWYRRHYGYYPYGYYPYHRRSGVSIYLR